MKREIAKIAARTICSVIVKCGNKTVGERKRMRTARILCDKINAMDDTEYESFMLNFADTIA